MKSQRQQTSRSKGNQILFLTVCFLRGSILSCSSVGKKGVWRFDFKELSNICPSTFHPPTYNNGATNIIPLPARTRLFHLSTLVSQKPGKREFHQKCREGWLGDVANGLHVSLPLMGAVMPGSNQFVTVTNAEGTLEMSTQLFEV